jgi:hypothetical protein
VEEKCAAARYIGDVTGADSGMESRSYQAILKRVGAVLVVIGLLDIGVMVYCIVHRISYRSSLNLFAVIAGILLLRGSLRTAATVRWFGVLFLSACITTLFALPAVQPMDLTLTKIRLSPGGFIADVAFVLLILALFYWVIAELGREPVQEASDSAGIKRRDMRFPVGVGISLVIGLGALLHVFLGGESAEHAKSMAEKLVGPGYRLHVSSMRVSRSGHTESVSGVVTAWNDKEIRDIAVHWEGTPGR